jgi:uncharacterized membrane protein YesL
MTKSTFLKFLILSRSNVKRYLIVNIILLIPLLGFIYGLIRVVPYGIGYLDSFNISIVDVKAPYDKLAIAVVSGEDGRVYVFKRQDFNRARRYLFSYRGNSISALEKIAVGYSNLPIFGESLTVRGKDGEPLMTLLVEGTKEDVIQIFFFNSEKSRDNSGLYLNGVMLFSSFIVLFGSLGGVSDFTQRVVFHETRDFGYLFRSIRRYFLRSLSASLFFTVVIGAIATNIYFYIFVISNDLSVFIAALNFWMLVFFIFILFWVYPFIILNRDESIWKVMKKSLFVSFDNFEFTLNSLLLLFLMLAFSCVTLFIFPGFAGAFSFMNSALKDISHRYTKPDTT